jgi:hypothetical protein
MQGTLAEGEGSVSTVDLLIKIGCFVKMEKYRFSMKSR